MNRRENLNNNTIIPAWIYNSEYVQMLLNSHYNIDAIISSIPSERIFEFPTRLSGYNIVKVLDNIRYFGVDFGVQNSQIYEQCNLLINSDVTIDREELQEMFPELNDNTTIFQ